MLKENAALGIRFTLPDERTVDDIDAYQKAVNDTIKNYNGTLTDMRYYAIVYATSVKQGLIGNWQCESMPTLAPESVGQVDAKVVTFVGRTIAGYIRSFTDIPPD